MTSASSVQEDNTKLLSEIKKFGESVKVFSEKIGGPPSEKRLPPILLFVKNYFRYYSNALVEKVFDVEFRFSSPLFEKHQAQKLMESLIKDFNKLHESVSSTMQEEQIAEYTNTALQEVLAEGFRL